jgi:hypothetical protein
MFGKTTIVSGKTYKIVGIAPKARKYPVIGQLGSGGKFKLTSLAVLSGMGFMKNLIVTKIDPPSASEVEKTA